MVNFFNQFHRTLQWCLSIEIFKLLKSKLTEIGTNHTEFQITMLPDEILMKIFSYIPTDEILLNVSPVCKRFYRLSLDSKLIQHLTLGENINDTNYENIYEVLNRAKFLTELCIKEQSDVIFLNNVIRKITEFCPNLSRLKIVDCVISSDCFNDFIPKLKELKSLKFDDNYLAENETIGNYDISLFGKCEKLQDITLDGFRRLRKDKKDSFEIEGLNETGGFINFLKQMKNTLKCFRMPNEYVLDDDFCKTIIESNLEGALEELEIYGGEECYDDEGREWQISETISKLKKIKVLGLNYFYHFSPEMIISMFADSKLENLVELEFFEVRNITDEVLKTVASNCPKLESFKLTQIESESFIDITNEGLLLVTKHCKNLRKFTLSLNDLNSQDKYKISDDFLYEMAKNCQKIEYLNLMAQSFVTEKAMMYLIKNCTALETLLLLYIYDFSDHFLFKIRQHLPKLRYLGIHVYHCQNITRSGVKRLKRNKNIKLLTSEDMWTDILEQN